jgi:hypothetical protein
MTKAPATPDPTGGASYPETNHGATRRRTKHKETHHQLETHLLGVGRNCLYLSFHSKRDNVPIDSVV